MASPLVLAASLSACSQLGMEAPSWPWDQQAAEAPAKRPAVERETAQPGPKPASKPAAVELKALRPAPRPAADKEVAAVPAQPPKLVGLSEAETAELLGTPSEISAEPPGKIWIYKATGCRLSVHLFPDMEKGGFYALDYTADGAKDSCLGKVAGEARKKGSAVVEESAKRG